jgi:hypothetical protein
MKRQNIAGQMERGRRMAISSLPWRLAAVLLAAAAAALALAMPAGASTGTAQISPEQAGYTATGAQFKTIDARVFLRQPTQYAGEVASFGHSVQLWSAGLVISVGLTASTSGGGYTTYATVYDRSTHQVIASNPNAQHCAGYGDFCAPGPVTWNYPGTTVWMRISYTPADGHLSMSEVLSSDSTDSNGNDFTSSYDLTAPQAFSQARVGTEFGSSPWDASYPYTPPARSLKVAAYTNVDLTSYSGHTASLSSWWVHHKLLANTGQQSGSDWVAVPADLSNGGASFQTFFLPQSAQGRP